METKIEVIPKPTTSMLLHNVVDSLSKGGFLGAFFQKGDSIYFIQNQDYVLKKEYDVMKYFKGSDTWARVQVHNTEEVFWLKSTTSIEADS